MKKAEDFKETLLLVMEDYDYTMEELEEDIKDLLMDEFLLVEKIEDEQKILILQSESLDRNLKLLLTESFINGEKILNIKNIISE